MDARAGAALRAAAEVVAVSDDCRDGVVRAYGLDPARVTVVHHGISGSFSPLAQPNDRERRSRLGVPSPYLLCVSLHEPRKNLETLIRAFGRLLAEWPAPAEQPTLVLVGASTPHTAILRALAEQVAPGRPDRDGGRVHFLEGVANADLSALYRDATALAFPSLCEGFGFPLVEALASGTPVVASDIAVFRELVGPSALYVDPADPDAWTGALRRVLSDAALRTRLIADAAGIAARYDWRRSAASTLDVLARVAERRAPRGRTRLSHSVGR
jgi:glycosyltransferase involved in cell wall biosynthesis